MISSSPRNNLLPVIHPGEILQKEFLLPMQLSQSKLAISINVPASRISTIVRTKRSITADTALRLGRFFNMSPQFWMNLQNQYDLAIATKESGNKISKEVQPLE